MDVQEAISRGRFIFSGAPERLEVFYLINGNLNAKEISKKRGRSLESVLNDIKKISNAELIRPKLDKGGEIIKKDGSIIYEKYPLVKSIPLSYFKDTKKGQKKLSRKKLPKKYNKTGAYTKLPFPNEKDIIDICRGGENQLYEFKTCGAEIKDITKEIAAFSVTKKGGLIFYGVDDNGRIIGTDIRRQDLDQKIMNSIRSSIDPTLIVELESHKITGTEIIIVRISPWNRQDVYQYQGRTYIRMGTNSMPANSTIVKKLHNGQYVI